MNLSILIFREKKFKELIYINLMFFNAKNEIL